MTPADTALLWDELSDAEAERDQPHAQRVWTVLCDLIPQQRESSDALVDEQATGI